MSSGSSSREVLRSREPRCVGEQVAFPVPGVFHGFEFDDIKGFEAEPDAFLKEKGGSALDDGQQNSQNDQYRKQAYQAEERAREIQGAFSVALVETVMQRFADADISCRDCHEYCTRGGC